jgi:hypothetical protein
MVAQSTELNRPPLALTVGCSMLAELPYFCTVVTLQLTPQHCAVSGYIGVHRGEERVEGMGGHEELFHRLECRSHRSNGVSCSNGRHDAQMVGKNVHLSGFEPFWMLIWMSN